MPAQGELPIGVVGDLPVLDHVRLQWPGLPLFVLGHLSMLSTGPGAADMPGLRWAADRIVAAINTPAGHVEHVAPPLAPSPPLVEEAGGSCLPVSEAADGNHRGSALENDSKGAM